MSWKKVKICNLKKKKKLYNKYIISKNVQKNDVKTQWKKNYVKTKNVWKKCQYVEKIKTHTSTKPPPIIKS